MNTKQKATFIPKFNPFRDERRGSKGSRKVNDIAADLKRKSKLRKIQLSQYTIVHFGDHLSDQPLTKNFQAPSSVTQNQKQCFFQAEHFLPKFCFNNKGQRRVSKISQISLVGNPINQSTLKFLLFPCVYSASY